MKCFFWGLFALLLATTSQAQPSAKPMALNVAFVVYPGVEALDLSGPLDVLLKANRLTNGAYHCYTVALTNSALATEQGGLHLRPDYTFQTMPKPDILVVPGTSPDVIQQLLTNHLLVSQIKILAPKTPLVMSVCTGALLLAQAGVLDGRRATTHAAMTDALAQQFPRVRLVRGVRYVADGPVLTTAGVTAGIDGALYVVEKYSGRTVAAVVARAMAYSRPSEAKPQFTGPGKPAAAPRPGKPMPVATLAQSTVAQAAPAATLATLTDPVCHMSIVPTTTHRYSYQGKTYGFCSESCRAIFVAKPRQYVP